MTTKQSKKQDAAIAALKEVCGLTYKISRESNRLIIYRDKMVWKDYYLDTFNEGMMADLISSLLAEQIAEDDRAARLNGLLKQEIQSLAKINAKDCLGDYRFTVTPIDVQIGWFLQDMENTIPEWSEILKYDLNYEDVVLMRNALECMLAEEIYREFIKKPFYEAIALLEELGSFNKEELPDIFWGTEAYYFFDGHPHKECMEMLLKLLNNHNDLMLELLAELKESVV